MNSGDQHADAPSTARLLDELARHANDLDGFPVAALLASWPDGRVGTPALMQRVLSHWLTHIDRQLVEFPAAYTDTLSAMRQRLTDTRAAICSLMAVAAQVSRQDEPKAAEIAPTVAPRAAEATPAPVH
ncbi:hypothetical protein [Ideonella sp. A 288]|uniref:hypothetical protein n=1 Tax=Ideonella sp. A 288 TaxID=1962181 RepID=UPI000B4B4E63|nr:hypothetical protein [Ideonella sp. A 288]